GVFSTSEGSHLLKATMDKYVSPPDSIYLVGFMGSGKSTIGPLLAQRLGYRFVDLDSVIEQETGESIKEIFARHGESYFRRLETDTLRKLLHSSKLVIALGGGTFVKEENRVLLKRTGTSVWLKVSLEEAERRCRQEKQRPLARDKSQFEKLYKDRQAIYQSA